VALGAAAHARRDVPGRAADVVAADCHRPGPRLHMRTAGQLRGALPCSTRAVALIAATRPWLPRACLPTGTGRHLCGVSARRALAAGAQPGLLVVSGPALLQAPALCLDRPLYFTGHSRPALLKLTEQSCMRAVACKPGCHVCMPWL